MTSYTVLQRRDEGFESAGDQGIEELKASTDAQARKEAAKLAKQKGWTSYEIEFWRDADHCRGTIDN